MDNLLKENVSRTIGYVMSEEECHDFSQFFFSRTFDKKAILAEEGRNCRYVYFILKGSCYSCYTNETGDKHAMQFAIEGHWISDHYSFFSGQPGMYTIETIEPTDVLVLNRENYDKICASSHLFEHFFHILIQNAFVAQQYRLAMTNSEEAEHRYVEFLRRYPHFVQRIPQYLIASYLGIKPQSLSRIRKEMSSKKG